MKKKILLDNYNHFDIIWMYPGNSNLDMNHPDIYVYIRRYQSSVVYKKMQEGQITVVSRDEVVLELVDTGNGINGCYGNSLDYCQLEFLTLALKSYYEDANYQRRGYKMFVKIPSKEDFK